MSGLIQLIPPGLLGLFDIKTMGRNPAQLEEAIVPTLETLRWYMNAKMEYLPRGSVSIAPGNTGTQNFVAAALTVPDDQWWYVHFFTVRVGALVATDTVKFRACLNLPLQVLSYGVGDDSGLVVGTATQRQATSCAIEPFWAPPGSALGFILEANETGAPSLAYIGDALITRLPV